MAIITTCYSFVESATYLCIKYSVYMLYHHIGQVVASEVWPVLKAIKVVGLAASAPMQAKTDFGRLWTDRRRCSAIVAGAMARGLVVLGRLFCDYLL